jgi:hypothetical protein
MKTAEKLAQIARVNQQGMFNLIQNDKVIHQGSFDSCQAIMYERGGTFTIEKVKEIDHYEQFQKKVAWGSHHYVRYVIKRCKELASKGYGSVKITIDRTTDMFDVDEGRNSCYSYSFVCKLLVQEGFTFDWYGEDSCDHYDAVSGTLIWDETLPKFPEEISMSWEEKIVTRDQDRSVAAGF